MEWIILAGLLALLLAPAKTETKPANGTAQPPAGDGAPESPGRLELKLEGGSSNRETCLAVLLAAGVAAEVLGWDTGNSAFVLEVPHRRDLEGAIAALKGVPNVVTAIPFDSAWVVSEVPPGV